MIKSQQSEEENEGFFKPQQKVIKVQQCGLKQFEGKENDEQGRQLGDYERPSDFKARIINVFENLNHYPEYLMGDKCQQSEEEIGQRIVSQKISQKYLTLQEKYLNTNNYKMVYSKISNNEFNNYIFSLNYLTDYSQKNYLIESPLQTSINQQKNQQQKVNEQLSFKFDSKFQSGNLLYAFQDLSQTAIPTFDLIIQNDTNTRGYNQWFYFSVEKILKNLNNQQIPVPQERKNCKTIRIRIVNFIKKHLMFQDGVRPVALFESQKEWKFIGREVQYKKSYIKRNIQFNGSNVTKNFYTLSFLIDFQQENQINQKVYIALNYPYPYKRAISLINQLVSSNTTQSIEIKKQTICHTISNNQVPYLIINSKPTQKEIQTAIKSFRIKKQKQKQKEKLQKVNSNETQVCPISENICLQMSEEQAKHQILTKRKKILLFARQHPGQTVGSFVLQGFLRQLVNGINGQCNLSKADNQEQKISQTINLIQGADNNLKLLKQYTIYVFPMINVDGVIYGNFRTNLAGFDLNRQWIQPNKWLHPEIYHLKKLIATLKNIEFVLDFHGHSRKLNSFIYACNNPVPILMENQEENNYPNVSMFRLYPYIFSKQTDLFSIKDCTYTISKDKIKTARINTFKSLNFNPYIFTLQTGFYGYTKQDKKYRFKIHDFYTIGKAALQSLKTVLLKPKKTKEILKDVQNKSYLFDMWAYENKQDPGSESNPSQDQLNPIEIKTKVLAQQRLKQKQKRRNDILNRNISQNKKTSNKRQRKKRVHKKFQTELKSQRKIIELNQTDIQIIYQKRTIDAQKVSRKQIKSQNQKSKPMKIEYYPDKKRNLNSELFNVVAMKQAVLQKPQFYLPLPNNRQKNNNRVQIKISQQDFKTTSNLLGNGLGHYQNKVHRILQTTAKSNPPTLQMLEINNIKRDIRIQSSVDVSTYEDSKMRTAEKLNQRENKIKDQFFSLHRQEDNNKFSRQSQGERIFVVKDNKIVKVVNNVNKTKSQSTILQGDLNLRQNNLKKCQEKMTSDDKTLMEEIKEQRIDEKVRRKKVFLNPIQY